MRVYNELKTLLFKKEIERSQIADVLGRSRAYIDLKLSGKGYFRLDEVYKICDLADIDYSDISKYFPLLKPQRRSGSSDRPTR